MSTHDQKKSGIELELLANVMESIEAAVVDGQPPVAGTPGAIVPAGQAWTPVGDSLPPSLLAVEAWNSAWDAIEAAYYDAGTKSWHSNYNGLPYFLGTITHWRLKA
jgi:hypothetical protein